MTEPAFQESGRLAVRHIGWITGAKMEATTIKRLDRMLEELESGDRYMKMHYNGPK